MIAVAEPEPSTESKYFIYERTKESPFTFWLGAAFETSCFTGLDVRSQEEFDLFDSVDDEQDLPMVITLPGWISTNYDHLLETLSTLRSAQVGEGVRASFRICLSRVHDARERVSTSFKVVFIISVASIIVIWLSWSIQRPEISTNSRPLWARTRLEVDSHRDVK